MHKQINKYDCFLMCILFYLSLVRLSVCAFAIHSMYANLCFKTTIMKQNLIHKNVTNCGSAFEPGASGLPYYYTSICVRSRCNWRASL